MERWKTWVNNNYNKKWREKRITEKAESKTKTNLYAHNRKKREKMQGEEICFNCYFFLFSFNPDVFLSCLDAFHVKNGFSCFLVLCNLSFWFQFLMNKNKTRTKKKPWKSNLSCDMIRLLCLSVANLKTIIQYRSSQIFHQYSVDFTKVKGKINTYTCA
jgi:hypothetical protein